VYNGFQKLEEYIMNIFETLSKIAGLVIKGWIYLIQCAVILFVVLLFVPGVSVWEWAQGLANITIIMPAAFMFEYFQGAAEYFRNAESVNGIHAFSNMFLMLGSIVLMLGLPAFFWFMHLLMAAAAVLKSMPTAVMDYNIMNQHRAGDASMFDRNDWYLGRGLTSVDAIFKAEVEATAIASELKRK